MCDYCLECGVFLNQCEDAKENRPSYESKYCLEGNALLCEKCRKIKEKKNMTQEVENVVEETEEQAESPIIAEVLECPVCGHPIGKHTFHPMEILLKGEIIEGSSIHCTDITCERASKEGEACFVENFLELLEPIVDDGSEEE